MKWCAHLYCIVYGSSRESRVWCSWSRLCSSMRRQKKFFHCPVVALPLGGGNGVSLHVSSLGVCLNFDPVIDTGRARGGAGFSFGGGRGNGCSLLFVSCCQARLWTLPGNVVEREWQRSLSLSQRDRVWGRLLHLWPRSHSGVSSWCITYFFLRKLLCPHWGRNTLPWKALYTLSSTVLF